MARNRIVGLTVVELEDIDALYIEAAKTCLQPAIEYLRQTARTAADAQCLRNLIDAQQAILTAQLRLTAHHPERRE